VNRNKAFILSLLMILVLLLVTAAGCGNSGNANGSIDDPNGEANSQVIKREALRIGTASTGGLYYSVGGTLANIINNSDMGVDVSVLPTGGGIENMRLMHSGEIEMGFTVPSWIYYGERAKGPFEDGAIKNMKAIASLYPQYFQMVVRKDSGMTTWSDLKGKKVSVGPPGSGEMIAFEEMMDVFGLTSENIDKKVLTLPESGQNFKDGMLDAFWTIAGAPVAVILDVSSQVPVNILSMSEQQMQTITKNLPYYSIGEMPANSYPDQPDKVPMLTSYAVLIVRDDVPEDIVYNFTREMFENIDEIHLSHKQAEEITLETALDGIDELELHPGAARYYKEKDYSYNRRHVRSTLYHRFFLPRKILFRYPCDIQL
jgi:TRAP transporter TAXI family solute receptor